MTVYIYVISNPAFDGWYKIGKTKNLSNRLSTYRTGSPFEYKLELVDDQFVCDKPIHNKLLALGTTNVREWFKTDLDTIERAMADVAVEFEESANDDR